MVLGMYLKSGKTITLNDKDGVDGLVVKDNEGFVVHKLASNGDIQYKGRLTRTTTN